MPDGRMQQIPVKMYRSAERITVAAPMPGLEPQDIAVDIRSDGQLALHGEVRGLLKEEHDVLADEWNPGPYHREVELPSPVNGEMANVTYNNGIVVVALPRSATMHPAHLSLQHVSPTHGERAGNEGRPPVPPHDSAR
jgi:HSP20 family protein